MAERLWLRGECGLALCGLPSTCELSLSDGGEALMSYPSLCRAPRVWSPPPPSLPTSISTTSPSSSLVAWQVRPAITSCQSLSVGYAWGWEGFGKSPQVYPLYSRKLLCFVDLLWQVFVLFCFGAIEDKCCSHTVYVTLFFSLLLS